MSTLLIHRPTAIFDPHAAEAATTKSYANESNAFSVSGRSVGFRTENNWLSWIHLLGVWTTMLERDDATVITHLADGLRVGPKAAETTRLVAEWGARVEFAVSGLGTCGSCTSYTILDAITALRAGAKALAVVTEEFLVHARSIAKHFGEPELPILALPHPLEGRTNEELDAIAEEYYPQFVARLGALA